MHERNSRSGILQPFLMMVGAIVLIIYFIGALNTGNWFWILPIQPTYVPSRIVIRNHGQVTEYRPEDPEFAILREALDNAFSDFSNLDLVPIGLSEGTLQEYNESSVVMEIYYPQPIRFNTIVRMSNVNQLLIPIEGRHSGYRYLFPGSDGQWLAGAFVMEDEQPIYTTLRKLGYIE